MKKMRIIRLKSERMRRVRSEVRKLLLSAWWAREVKIKNTMDEIFEHCDPYYRNHIRESIQFSNIEVSLDEILEYGNLSHEDRLREMARLYKEQWKLDELLLHSICACRWCGDFEADLVYNPVMKAWYCEDCYLKRQEKHPELYPRL